VKGDVKNPLSESLPIWPTALVSVITFIIYIMTLSPGVSWAHHSEDSGDLITAAYTLGIPHPTGYPLYCLLGWVWSHVVMTGTVAWRMNLLSALFGALASGIMVRAVWSSFKLLSKENYQKIPRSAKIIAAISSGLILGLAVDTWKLSVVAEVYTLNLFFVSVISWILIELLIDAENGVDLPKRKLLLISMLGFSWGLALTNHLTSIFLFPGMAIILIFGGLRLNLKILLTGIGCTVAALLVYLYLPIRSAMEPSLDWGNPQTVGNFIWVVTGKQFRKLMFTLLPFQMLGQIVRYTTVPGELGVPAAVLSLLGLCRLILEKNKRLLLLFIYTALLVVSTFFYLSSYAIWDPEGYLLPMLWALSFWAGWGIALLTLIPEELRKFSYTLLVLLLIASPVVSMVGHWKDVDLSANHNAIRFGEESFEAFEENALVIEMRYERAFTLWYYREIEYAETRDDVAVVFIEHMQFDWGLELLKRKYPDLILPETPLTGGEMDEINAEWIVENNIDDRPIYSGAMVDELSEKGYRFVGVGLMFRVFPPETQ